MGSIWQLRLIMRLSWPAQVKLWAMTDKLGITGKLKSEDKELVGKPLMKRIMQSWLPAHEVGSPHITRHLSCPLVLQIACSRTGASLPVQEGCLRCRACFAGGHAAYTDRGALLACTVLWVGSSSCGRETSASLRVSERRLCPLMRWLTISSRWGQRPVVTRARAGCDFSRRDLAPAQPGYGALCNDCVFCAHPCCVPHHRRCWR